MIPRPPQLRPAPWGTCRSACGQASHGASGSRLQDLPALLQGSHGSPGRPLTCTWQGGSRGCHSGPSPGHSATIGSDPTPGSALTQGWALASQHQGTWPPDSPVVITPPCSMSTSETTPHVWSQHPDKKPLPSRPQVNSCPAPCPPPAPGQGATSSSRRSHAPPFTMPPPR